ncbi:metallopeptidase [Gloeobacter kilaueensis JS1]|uniref:Metallopeptidase n=1 Tax=Gloeobacter kilaueensis (strain ATCC BAA-2537 / CCAP 1431/1 / ULC 316 / JS1) TaxID=1183438 RepID=U5QD10_GLOK1|nr:metallopeptidase [Gloeobacter kilaueensis JS1]
MGDCAPCRDFDRFVNRQWRQTHPIPAGYESWDRFDELDRQNEQRLRQLLQGAAAHRGQPGSNRQKLGDYYASCLATQQIEAAGLTPIVPELARIAAIHTRAELQEVITRLHSYGIDVLFSLTADDEQSTGAVGALLAPANVILDDPTTDRRRILAGYASELLRLAGAPAATAAADARTVLAIEAQLAGVSGGRARQMTPAQLTRSAPRFDWRRYFQVRGLGRLAAFRVEQPALLPAIDRLLKTVPVERWRVYLRWRLLDALALYLGSRFRSAGERFSDEFEQRTAPQPRQQRCIDEIDAYLGDALGEAFVDAYFDRRALAQIKTIAANLKAATDEAIARQSWLSKTTRQRAHDRLVSLQIQVGRPDRWRDYSSLIIDRRDYSLNVLRAWQLVTQSGLERIGRLPDRNEWDLSLAEVNSSYDPITNTIALPAGLLQPPIFDPLADAATNYGALGSIIGHEITHAVSPLDQLDNPYEHWWPAADGQRFTRRAHCLRQQLTAAGVDGRRALAETVADFEGMRMAHAALQRTGNRQEQRFYVSYARLWAASEPPGSSTSYAPARWRVNLPLANFPGFARTFRCREGAAMARPPAQRCWIW